MRLTEVNHWLSYLDSSFEPDPQVDILKAALKAFRGEHAEARHLIPPDLLPPAFREW